MMRALRQSILRPAARARSVTSVASRGYKGHGTWRWRIPSSFVMATGVATAMSAFSVSAVADCEENDTMYYRMLGNTGLQVSVLSFGFWATFGAKPDIKGDPGIERAKDILREARKGGVNFFDNAETYGSPQGSAELIMGEAIRQLREEDPELWRRTDIMVSTKIFWGGPGVNEKGLSRKHIKEGLTNACKRLQVDYVDLVYCHRPDPLTPTETVVRAMTDAVRSGKATAWGTSEWSAQQITEAVWIARQYGLEPPQFEQPQYNMFHRERFEKEYTPLYQPPYNYGTTIWSPLSSGILTGKYNNSIPEGSRATAPGYTWVQKRIDQWHKEGKIAKVRELTQFAAERYNCSMTQLALAWCVKNQNVSTVLLGATKVSQIKENLQCLRVAREMTDEDYQKINAILGNTPDPYGGYGTPARYRSINTI